MERRIITVPRDLMRSFQVDWDIDWRGSPTPEAVGGNTGTIINSFPRWTGSPQLYLNRAQVTQWRAIRAAAQGRVCVYRVPLIDPIGFSPVATGGALVRTGIPFANGQTFSNGQGFAYTPFALGATAASAGATELRIDVSPTGVAPNVGQIMDHDYWPFVITDVSLVSGTIYAIGIQMPLRKAMAVDDVIRMEGVGLFEAAEDSMGNPAYGRNHKSQPQLQFREWLTRP